MYMLICCLFHSEKLLNPWRVLKWCFKIRECDISGAVVNVQSQLEELLIVFISIISVIFNVLFLHPSMYFSGMTSARWHLPHLSVLRERSQCSTLGTVLWHARWNLDHAAGRRLRNHHGVVQWGRQSALRPTRERCLLTVPAQNVLLTLLEKRRFYRVDIYNQERTKKGWWYRNFTLW